jgi:hypothetical protein
MSRRIMKWCNASLLALALAAPTVASAQIAAGKSTRATGRSIAVPTPGPGRGSSDSLANDANANVGNSTGRAALERWPHLGTGKGRMRNDPTVNGSNASVGNSTPRAAAEGWPHLSTGRRRAGSDIPKRPNDR